MEEQVEKVEKTGFFKKLWISIARIEKYPDIAAEGFGRAFSYVCKIVAILAIVICLGTMYQTYQVIQEGISYLKNEFPNFSYKDGILDVETEEKFVISEEDSYIGRTIIDTKTQDEATINEYIKEIEEVGNGVVILRDKAVLKNASVTGSINYKYDELLDQQGITEFTKQSLIDYANSSQIISLYVSIFIMIFISSFLLYLITTLSNAVFIAVFGYLATLFAFIRIRLIAIYNMAVYALTLPVLLNIIYIIINMFIEFNIKYFQVMYMSVGAIYIVAAIFLLKSDIIKKKEELMKIEEVQAAVRKEMEEKEAEEKREKEKKERQKKDKEEEKKQKENDGGEEPEGSNA